jgi:hypothetical protein
MHAATTNHTHLRETPALTQTLKVQEVSPTNMVEHRKKGICYYYDEKYSSSHKFHQTISSRLMRQLPLPMKTYPQMRLLEDTKPIVHIPDPFATLVEPKKPIVSLNSLTGISAPQTLKIKGYIKHRLIVVLIDSGSTNNFIQNRVVEEVNCFVRLVSNFQILIANGGMMKCGGHCENFKLQMGDYHLKNNMFSIAMGGCDIVLGVEWLHTLGPITMDYQDLYMSFTQDAHTYTLQGIQVCSLEIISSY